MKKILIVDDDPLIVEVLHGALQDQNYQLIIARNGKEGLELFKKTKFDLVILDVVMPVMNGLEFCINVRKIDTITKILMLTSKSSSIDKVNGFFIGVNDYLTKPFSMDELIARVNNLLKSEKDLKLGNMTLSVNNRTLHYENKEIIFCQKEFDLLTLMMKKHGVPISRDEILDSLWNKNEIPFPNTIDVHIRRLRKKLYSNFSKELIRTVHGIGYMLDI